MKINLTSISGNESVESPPLSKHPPFAPLQIGVVGEVSPAKVHRGAPGAIQLSLDTPGVRLLIDTFLQICLEKNKDFPKDPEALLQLLSNPQRAEEGLKPRLEFREVVQKERGEYANIAFCFPNGEERDKAFPSFKSDNPYLSIVSAGSTTLEVGINGVNKGTVLHAIAKHLPEILPHYKPGSLIDAMAHRSVLCMDADGTLWGKPETGKSPTANHLGNSPTQRSILNYLRAGGALAVISGNDPTRTVSRFLDGIPQEEREELLSRVILSGAGGHTLMTWQNGEFQEYLPYRKQALADQLDEVPGADLLYFGDDEKKQGNDFPGFEKLGEDRSLCVSSKNADHVKTFQVPGETDAVRRVIDSILEKRKLLQGAKELPVFTETSRVYTKENKKSADAQKKEPTTTATLPLIRQQTIAKKKAGELLVETLAVIPREKVNEWLYAQEHRFNGPVHYELQTIEELKAAQKQLPQTGEPLNFAELLRLSHVLKERVSVDRLEKYSTLPKEGEDPISLIKNALDQSDLKAGDVVRILVPGNNDQSNSLWVAEQVKVIQAYGEEKKIPLSIEILVMGQGGHATTALFHQFAQIDGDLFRGVEEAFSLGETLKNSLEQAGFKTGETLFYDTSLTKKEALKKTSVQIQLAPGSRHTGMNVQEANQVFAKDTKKPRHIFVTSATASSTRQALTFAYQMAQDTYHTITGVPAQKSKKFIQYALNDMQAVTELYAGLAERARFYQYGFQEKPFIPPSVLDEAALLDLYECYDCLSQTNDLDKAKRVPMDQVLKFFQTKFQQFEEAIIWSQSPDLQSHSTKGSIRKLQKNQKQKEAFEEAYVLYRKLSSSPEDLTNGQKKAIRVFEELRTRASQAKTDEEKEKYFLLMGAMGKQLLS